MKSGFWQIVIVVTLTMILVGGCGEYVGFTYYYPDWTPDGKIICVKLRRSSSGSGGMWNPSPTHEDRYYITIMDEDGNNERDIKEISRVGQVAASPLGNYIAYTDQYIIKIINMNGQDIGSIDCGSKIYAYDWSPNDSKLIYKTEDEVVAINVNDLTKYSIIGKGYGVAWRYGDKIIVNRIISTEVFRIVALNSDLSEHEYYPLIMGGDFNISRINTNEVYYRDTTGYTIKKFNVLNAASLPEVIIDDIQILYIKLSPNGQKIIGTGIGSQDLNGSEIWIVNIDGSDKKQLK